MTKFQYRDPLNEVLDYIVEVRLPGHDCPRLMHSVVPKRNVVLTTP